MKKLIYSLLTVATLTTSSNAQVFEQDKNFISVGYGIGNGLGRFLKSYKTFDDYKYNSFGPIVINAERGLTDHIGIGFNFSYAHSKASWSQDWYYFTQYEKFSITQLAFMARAAYHFTIKNKKNIDPYAGLGMGYRSISFKIENVLTPTPSDNEVPPVASATLPWPIAFNLFMGIRYMINNNFGVYAEAGYGVSVLNAGATLSF